MTTKIYKYEIAKYIDDVSDGVDIIEEVHIFADEGKVFRDIRTGEILTNHLSIGTEDSAANYEEITL